LSLVSPNGGTDLPAAVELAVSETERAGGTEKRIECPFEDLSAPKEVRASTSAAPTLNQ
jgi:hypothetical protein